MTEGTVANDEGKGVKVTTNLLSFNLMRLEIGAGLALGVTLASDWIDLVVGIVLGVFSSVKQGERVRALV